MDRLSDKMKDRPSWLARYKSGYWTTSVVVLLWLTGFRGSGRLCRRGNSLGTAIQSRTKRPYITPKERRTKSSWQMCRNRREPQFHYLLCDPVLMSSRDIPATRVKLNTPWNLWTRGNRVQWFYGTGAAFVARHPRHWMTRLHRISSNKQARVSSKI